MRVIGGDIGGTKTLMALFEVGAERITYLAEQSYPSADYSNFDLIFDDFLQRHGEGVCCAAFGVAGPVNGHKVQTTNLPWRLDALELKSRTGLEHVGLLNDLEATGYGILELPAEELHTLYSGKPGRRGNAAVIAAGTGLGEGGLYWDGKHYHPFATEGGHSGFAPEDAEQRALLEFLFARYERVGWERVLSGSALPDLFEFIIEQRGAEPPAELLARMEEGDPGAVISAAAQEGEELCDATLALFARLYASEAANLALKMLAIGGIYLGGGIAPKILPWLNSDNFTQAFLNKAPMNAVVEQVPVRVVMNSRAALLGAARFATRVER